MARTHARRAAVLLVQPKFNPVHLVGVHEGGTRAIVSSVVISAAGIGGLLASNIFTQASAPLYLPRIIATVLSQVLLVTVLCATTVYFRRQNARPFDSGSHHAISVSRINNVLPLRCAIPLYSSLPYRQWPFFSYCSHASRLTIFSRPPEVFFVSPLYAAKRRKAKPTQFWANRKD
ncbi:hypothetical protein B0H13DRAFT_2300147 [Mycena leptocephala]|nr:hypothetical protein B0H13DRAFT_2300147 [Mycena leptocephala]